jgi:hypothetical protein
MGVSDNGSSSDVVVVEPPAAPHVVLDLCTPPDAASATEAADLPSCKKLKTEHDSDNVSDLTREPFSVLPVVEAARPSAVQAPPLTLVSLVDIDRLVQLGTAAATAAEGSSESKMAGANVSSDTLLATLREQTVGSFLVQGTAVFIRKFRVSAASGYVVNLVLEGDAPRVSGSGSSGSGTDNNSGPDDTGMAASDNVIVPVQISSDLCAQYLGVSVAEYMTKQKSLSKEAAKEMKIASSLEFQDFRGTFVARLLAETKEPSASGTANGNRSQQSAGDGAILELLDRFTMPT